MESLADVWRSNARYNGDRIAAVDGDRSISFGEAYDRAQRLASAIHRRGLRKHDRVGMLAMNRLEWVEYLGATALGGTIGALEAGTCEVVLPFRDDLTQQKGFIHGGIIGMIADSACGYAAYSLMPADCSLVTVEYKINILAPAVGERLVARGEVIRPGRTLTVARAEVYAEKDGRSVHCASMQQTLMMLAGRSDHPD